MFFVCGLSFCVLPGSGCCLIGRVAPRVTGVTASAFYGLEEERRREGRGPTTTMPKRRASRSHRAAVIVALGTLLQGVSSFAPTNSHSSRSDGSVTSPTQLFDLIRGEAIDAEPFSLDEGGVGLAKRTAVRVSGAVKPSSKEGTELTDMAKCIDNLTRYDRLRPVEESTVDSLGDVAVICKGDGKELYQDPGSSNRVEDKVVKLAPLEAAASALTSVSGSISEDKTVVFNFLGGDDLIIGEVTEACKMLVGKLEIGSKNKIRFNSVSFTDVPAGTCSVTVVATGASAGGKEGAEASVARGELYSLAGGWATVSEGDAAAED